MILDIFLIFLVVFFLSLSVFFAWTVVCLPWTKVPFIPSSRDYIDAMKKLADLQKGDTVADLGCGFGDVLFSLEKKDISLAGYELLWPVCQMARLRAFFKKSSVQFRCQDFFKADLSEVNVVVCYLWPTIMKRIAEEIWPHLPVGTKMVSHAFSLPGVEPEAFLQVGKQKVFLYRKTEPKKAQTGS